MADNSSSYPTAVDPQPPFLADEHDFVPLDAVAYLVNQLTAIQTEIGADAVNFAAMGGSASDYSSLAAFYGALFRYQADAPLVTTAAGNEVISVEFATGRFTEPPFVMVTGVNTAAPGADNYFEAKNVTTTGFELGDALHAAGWGGGGKYICWVAIQPIWGLEQDLEF
jgi:hypothetical protein